MKFLPDQGISLLIGDDDRRVDLWAAGLAALFGELCLLLDVRKVNGPAVKALVSTKQLMIFLNCCDSESPVNTLTWINGVYDMFVGGKEQVVIHTHNPLVMDAFNQCLPRVHVLQTGTEDPIMLVDLITEKAQRSACLSRLWMDGELLSGVFDEDWEKAWADVTEL